VSPAVVKFGAGLVADGIGHPRHSHRRAVDAS
jgi:hypothetical protein